MVSGPLVLYLSSMEPADLQGRLAALPGVISATVGDETVALLGADADPRLLKARAQAVCAEMGETRPLVVAGGRAGAGAGGPGGRGSGSLGRHTTPVTIALASVFVLSAVVLAPGGSNRSNPLSRRQSSPSVALAPAAPAPAEEAVAPPADSLTPATPTESPVPTFTRAFAPAPSSPRPAALGAGPGLVRLETASSASGPAPAPAPAFSTPTFGPQLASARPATSRSAEPGKDATPPGHGQPTATAASTETPAPAEPVPTTPTAETRTSSPQVAASGSDDPTLSASSVGGRRAHRKTATAERSGPSPHGRSAATGEGASGANDPPDKPRDKADKADKEDKAERSGRTGRPT